MPKHTIKAGQVWLRHGADYIVQEVSENTRIAHNGETWPTVTYWQEGSDDNYVMSTYQFERDFIFVRELTADEMVEINIGANIEPVEISLSDHIGRKMEMLRKDDDERARYAASVLRGIQGEIANKLYEPPVDPLTALRAIITWIGELNVNAGWWKDANNDLRYAESKVLRQSFVGAKLALVHSEVSEALEGWRKSSATKTLMDDHLPAHPMVTVEIADALVRLFDLAANVRLLEGNAALDVAQAFVDKVAYNQVRADHRPEARAADGGKGI